MTSTALRGLLRRHGVWPKKKYGQNFLLDGHVLQKILDAANPGPEDFVLEIGPGAGALTHALARRAGKVAAVEIDRALLPVLAETLEGCPNVEVIAGDILRLNPEELFPQSWAGGRLVVANLPYNIATAILLRLFQIGTPLRSMTVMLQKEAAARLTAQPGGKEYGALTLVAAYYATAQWVANVPPHCFFPRPEVDSAVLTFTPHPQLPVPVQDADLFFSLVRRAFATRRKTLANCLDGFAGLPKGALGEMCGRLGFSETLRGEALTLGQMAALANAIAEVSKGTSE
jgi:16S rRNA (adenine1518-N6/adenine1519-N6)-dimethyltransferase